MASRIPYRHLARLAQSQGAGSRLSSRCFQIRPSVQRIQAQYFSISPAQRQEPKQVPNSSAQPVDADSLSQTPTTTQTTPPPSTEPPASPKPRRRLVPRLIFATAFLLLGISTGASLRLLVNPPTPPEPDTHADELATRQIREQAAQLAPKVEALLTETSDGAVWESWDAYESLTPEHKAQHISAGALRGMRGVGAYQRVWHNPATGEFASLIYFGPATAGWPGVVHGGLLATILDESCGRAAFKQWGGKGGLTAKLELDYRRMTMANHFYLVMVRPRTERELPEEERGKRHYKCFVQAKIHDLVKQEVTVEAEALFIASKKEGEKRKNGLGWDAKLAEEHMRF